MYLKLHNPVSKQTMVLGLPDEVAYKPVGPFNDRETTAWHESQEGVGYDARHFVVWPTNALAGEQVHLTEIYIPGARGGRPTMVLTNWDCWVVNEAGRTMERVHRYLSPLG